MSTKDIKTPQKGAVSRVTDVAKKLRKQPVSPRLREIFKKENNKTWPQQDKVSATPLK